MALPSTPAVFPNFYNGYGIYGATGPNASLQEGKYNDLVRFGVALLEIAFFMLDPNPRMRITIRQMATILGRHDLYYNSSINDKSYRSYRLPTGPRGLNLPLHSQVKDTDKIDYPENPEATLVIEVAPDWEPAEWLWLASHMWW